MVFVTMLYWDLRVPGLIPQATVTVVASIMDAHKGQLGTTILQLYTSIALIFVCTCSLTKHGGQL